jgi:DNA-binding MarR family transcriptional regulator
MAPVGLSCGLAESVQLTMKKSRGSPRHKVPGHVGDSFQRVVRWFGARRQQHYGDCLRDSAGPGPRPAVVGERAAAHHAAVVPKLERRLAAVGMPLSWYDVLLVLNAAPDRRLRMTELGFQAVLSRERVSRVVTELGGAGLVVREPNPADGRSLFARITSAGRAGLRAAAPIYLAGIDKHFAQYLSDAEVRTLTTALGTVVAAEEERAHTGNFGPDDHPTPRCSQG